MLTKALPLPFERLMEWRANLDNGDRYDVSPNSLEGGFSGYFFAATNAAGGCELLENGEGRWTFESLDEAMQVCAEHHAKRTAGGSDV